MQETNSIYLEGIKYSHKTEIMPKDITFVEDENNPLHAH